MITGAAEKTFSIETEASLESKFTVAGIIKKESSDAETDIPKWQEILYKFTRNVGTVLSVVVILFIGIFSFSGEKMTPYTYDELVATRQNLPPRVPVLEKYGIFDGSRNGVSVYEQKGVADEYHYFGTDSLGRDLWERVWFGTKISLYVAILAVAIDVVIGVTIGLICGYFGGAIDMVIQRIIEIISGVPNLVVVTLLLIILKPGLFTITLALLMTSWIGMSRIVRAQVLQLKEREYVLAAKTLGTKDIKIMLEEILPNTLGQIIVMAMMSVPGAIFMESFLSFIGLGVPEPMASLGSLISSSFNNMLLYPYQTAIPVIIFSALMVSFNLVADGLRDAIDPKMYD